MVKQFTIPCKFGQETSPVTLYIGHPDGAHHPIHFQSEWLSTTKGGVIPQDLMNTLQKLHDLAKENGVDFENLCYYALISATQHSINGVTPDEVHKYADEFVKNENTGIEQTLDSSPQQKINENNELLDTIEIKTNSNNNKANNTTSYNYTKEDEDLLLSDNSDTIDTLSDNGSSNKTTNENNNINNNFKFKSDTTDYNYSQEDEDLLLNISSNNDDNSGHKL